MKQCINEGWKVRELKRQMKSCLFQRLALNTDKERVLALANDGHQEEASSLYFISHPTLFLLNIFNLLNILFINLVNLRVCEYYL